MEKIYGEIKQAFIHAAGIEYKNTPELKIHENKLNVNKIELIKADHVMKIFITFKSEAELSAFMKSFKENKLELGLYLSNFVSTSRALVENDTPIFQLSHVGQSNTAALVFKLPSGKQFSHAAIKAYVNNQLVLSGR